VRFFALALGLVATVLLIPGQGRAQDRLKLLEINGFMIKGVFTELDAELRNNRLSPAEIAKSHLDGHATDVSDVLGLMARLEKLRSKVAEPGEVRGEIPVELPLNATGDEAYTTCYYAFNFNGLTLAGQGDELILLRPETRPELTRPERPWNRSSVLSTRLFRLGYLKPDPIMTEYRDQIGTRLGHVLLEPKSNSLIVSDTDKSVKALGRHIDTQVLEAMGTPATDADAAPGEPRTPSLGAIASRENIHFYLMTIARWNRFPLAASQPKEGGGRLYPEAGLWTSEQAYRALENEYKRINTLYQLARQSRGEGWTNPEPDPALTPAEQRTRAIRFGLATVSPDKPAAATKKKTARKRKAGQ
jgi:hypothetical protein